MDSSRGRPAFARRADAPEQSALTNLLLVSPLFPPLHTGAGQQAESVLQQLEGQVHARVVTLGAPDLPRHETRNALVVERIASLSSHRPARAFGLAATKYLMTCPRPDVIWTLGVGPATYGAILIGRARGIPVVVKLTLEGQDDAATLRAKFAGATRLRCLRAASAVVCPSNQLFQISLDAGIDSSRLHRIPNGVDGVRFAPRDRSFDAGSATARRTQIAFVGLIVERKRLDLIVEAIADLTPEFPTLRLVIAGGWESPVVTPAHAQYIARLRARIAAPELANHILVLGSVERPEDVLAASSIFVLPSSAEGLPNALLEAMAAGSVPVVADLPVTREMVAPNAGVFVKEATPRAWSEALRILLRDPAAIERMGSAARATVMERFDLAVVARGYLDLFRRLEKRRLRPIFDEPEAG